MSLNNIKYECVTIYANVQLCRGLQRPLCHRSLHEQVSLIQSSWSVGLYFSPADNLLSSLSSLAKFSFRSLDPGLRSRARW